MKSDPFDLLFICAVAALLLVLVVGAAALLALAALFPRGSPAADWIREVVGKMPRFLDLGVTTLYYVVFVGGIALALIATLLYA